MNFNELIGTGHIYEFYGVFQNCFKLGSTVFEAIEDPDDGYRSYLESVILPDQSRGIFYKRPFALVTIEPSPHNDDGFSLVDANTGHVWLEVYTDCTDSYYPYFEFNYKLPEEPITEFLPSNACPKQLMPEVFI